MKVEIGPRHYQAECKVCGWTGALTIVQQAAENEGADHRCPPYPALDELSCAAGCVAGSRIVGGVWVPCEGCTPAEAT